MRRCFAEEGHTDRESGHDRPWRRCHGVHDQPPESGGERAAKSPEPERWKERTERRMQSKKPAQSKKRPEAERDAGRQAQMINPNAAFMKGAENRTCLCIPTNFLDRG